METKLLESNEESILLAAELLKKGELVAFPTETVYGLGANALDENAVRSIFAAKHRPADNPLIVHIWRAEQMEPLCEVNDWARKLMDAYWPGPLTMLLPKKALVPDATTAGLSSVAIRMPSHPVAQELLRVCDLPIAAPSANSSGRPSPTTALHVFEDMNGRIPLILDGGECSVGVESTVVDLTGARPTVLRPGGISPKQIMDVLGDACVADSVMRPLREGETAPSPGMKHKHYAPRGHMTLVKGERENVAREIAKRYDACGEKACILALESHLPLYGARDVRDMGKTNEEAAHNIFALLREMDEENIPRIFAEAVDEAGVGLAVMNRMARAAGFDIAEV